MKQPASIFNDVIGPVMIGPSSSHTAAAVRMGHLIRQMTEGRPEKIQFEFSKSGAVASTYWGQGSAFGLAGGILGYAADDIRLTHALAKAGAEGVDIRFQIVDEEFEHPNTYRITAYGGGRKIETEMVSTGGGMIEVRKIAGIPVLISGGFYETVILLGKTSEGDAKLRQKDLEAYLSSLAEITIHHNADGAYLLNVKSEVLLSQKILANCTAVDIIRLTPVLPVRSRKEFCGLFNTAQQIMKIAATEGLAIWEIAAKYEQIRGNISQEEVLEMMKAIVKIIENTLETMEKQDIEYADRILGRQAHLLSHAPQIPNEAMNSVIKHITLLMEAKSSMQVIVAAPTAGSCGAVPGTIIGVARVLGLDEDDIAKAMLTAGLIGILIAEHSTFAGEVCACQAECGSASGMAAAALVQLMGGTVEQALDAAAMALQNVFGLACDPVADRVEVPCLGKNILSGCNAMAMANLALAGFDKVIPLDETIAAMDQVGRLLPQAICCTGWAGLSVTETSKIIRHKLEQVPL